MRSGWRPFLVGLALLLLVLTGAAVWIVRGFDGARIQAIASDWMRTHQGRELVFEGPVSLQLWPQPALAVERVRLSERGRPDQVFARVAGASLVLHLEPLLRRRELEVERVAARGVTLQLRRDAVGASNVDDLFDRVGGGAAGSGPPLAIDRLELADVELQIDDAAAGVRGRLSLPTFTLGAFGRGLRSPLRLQAQAALEEPPLNGALGLDATLALLPPAQAGGSPTLRLEQARLQLRGQGFALEDLDVQLQAGSVQLDFGAETGSADTRLEVADARVSFAGRQGVWQVDSGRLAWQRLALGLLERRAALEQLELDLDGRREGTPLQARLRWPALDVQGDHLEGSAVEGSLALAGEQPLRLQLRAHPPGGTFERLTLPGLHLDIDGRIGARTLQGQADATLVLEPRPFAATLDGLALQLRLTEPARPPLMLALRGDGRLGPDFVAGQLAGTIDERLVEATFEARLDGVRPFVDLRADIGPLDLSRFVAAGPAPAAAAAIDLQPLRMLDGRLRLNVARLDRPPWRIDALALQADLDAGRLVVPRFSGRAWGGRFDASGSAEAASGALALRLRADEVDMRALLADTTGHDVLRGRGRIEADLRGRGATTAALRASLAGTLRLALQPAALRGVDLTQTLRGWRSVMPERLASDAVRQTDFSRLEAGFVLQAGVARSDDLDGRSEFLRVGGEGTIDLVQGRVDYLLRARVVDTASGRAGPEMVLLNGVTVPVQVEGPLDNVQWAVNWPAVTAAVAARSVPNVARGTVGPVARGATGVARVSTGVARGAAGVVRGAGEALRGSGAEPASR